MILLWVYIATAVVMWLPTARWLNDDLFEVNDDEPGLRYLSAVLAILAMWLWPLALIAVIGERLLRRGGDAA